MDIKKAQFILKKTSVVSTEVLVFDFLERNISANLISLSEKVFVIVISLVTLMQAGSIQITVASQCYIISHPELCT